MLCENNNRVYKYQYLLHLSIRLGNLEIHISTSTSEPSFKVIVLTSLAYLYFKRDIEQGGIHGYTAAGRLGSTVVLLPCRTQLKNYEYIRIHLKVC